MLSILVAWILGREGKASLWGNVLRSPTGPDSQAKQGQMSIGSGNKLAHL
jgi:hypothetical protein